MSNQCKHGKLARVCEICELERENAELHAKLEEVERQESFAVVEFNYAGTLRIGTEVIWKDPCKVTDGMTLFSHPAPIPEDKRDAERYQKLRSYHPRLEVRYWTGHWWEPLYCENLDAVLDDMLAAAPQPKEK